MKSPEKETSAELSQYDKSVLWEAYKRMWGDNEPPFIHQKIEKIIDLGFFDEKAMEEGFLKLVAEAKNKLEQDVKKFFARPYPTDYVDFSEIEYYYIASLMPHSVSHLYKDIFEDEHAKNLLFSEAEKLGESAKRKAMNLIDALAVKIGRDYRLSGKKIPSDFLRKYVNEDTVYDHIVDYEIYSFLSAEDIPYFCSLVPKDYAFRCIASSRYLGPSEVELAYSLIDNYYTRISALFSIITNPRESMRHLDGWLDSWYIEQLEYVKWFYDLTKDVKEDVIREYYYSYTPAFLPASEVLSLYEYALDLLEKDEKVPQKLRDELTRDLSSRVFYLTRYKLEESNNGTR